MIRPLQLAALLLLSGACSRDPVEVTETAGAAPPLALVSAPPRPEPALPELEERGDGLVVEVLERGSGPPARLGGAVLVHYAARLDGIEEPFDSSWSRGLPDRWSLSRSTRPRLVEGLLRGLPGLGAGTRCLVRIPPALGFGAEGLPAAGVPADAALVYEVSILRVLP